MSELTLPQVYRRAMKIIDERGWHRGWYIDDARRKVCIGGACAIALGGVPQPKGDWSATIFWLEDSDDAKQLWFAAADHLSRMVGVNYYLDITEWNDDGDRTLAEVKALLLKAAEQAEQSDG